jgi:hypothetical protein
MRYVDNIEGWSLIGVASLGFKSLNETERGALAGYFLRESGNSSLLELKSGAGLGLDGNLLVVTPPVRGGEINGGEGSTICEVRGSVLNRSKVNGCGPRPMLSLLIIFHSSSQAGIMWSTHSHPSGLFHCGLKRSRGQDWCWLENSSARRVVAIRLISPVLTSSSMII